jgi:hypothetical protein
VPYLYVLNGRSRHKVYRVGEKPAGEVVGQRDDAEVRLTDPWISWTHARVQKDGALVTIEDLGSTNGTYVNCEKVTRKSLAEDDVIFLGRTHLLYVASDRAPSAPPPIAARMAQQAALLGAEAGPAAAVVGETTQRVRVVLPGAPQHLPALDASQDSALDSIDARGGEPPGAREAGASLTTRNFRGPFADAGRLEELEWGDEDPDALPLPPTASIAPVSTPIPAVGTPIPGRPAARGGPESDDHFEIDIDELGLGPEPSARGRRARGSGEVPGDASTESDVLRVLEEERAARAGAAGPRGPGAAPDDEEPIAVHSIDTSAEIDPTLAAAAEIEHLRAQVAARDAEIARLRAELTQLRERYLDL